MICFVYDPRFRVQQLISNSQVITSSNQTPFDFPKQTLLNLTSVTQQILAPARLVPLQAANSPAPIEPVLRTRSGKPWTLTSSRSSTPMWTPLHHLRPKSCMSPKMSNLPLLPTLEMNSLITLCTYLMPQIIHTMP